MIPSRLLSMVGRLTPPPIVRGTSLPQLGRICQSATPPPSSDSTQPAPVDRPTLFSDLLRAKEEQQSSPAPPTVADICREARARRCVFVGEQHQQPKVLSAQLQLLNHIARGDKVGTDAAASSSPSTFHVVLEQWSLDDQPLLHKINATDNAAEIDALLNESGDQTSEGFPVAFYGQLIRLTRQLGGTVWGGFPPRSWARIVARGGSDDSSATSLDLTSAPADSQLAFHQVQQLDQARFERTSAEMGSGQPTIPVMPVERYGQVSNISWAHRTFLKSMFAPTDRPDVPPGACAAAGGAAAAPMPPPEAYKGFAAAQALKDTFFAHTISTLLQRNRSNIVVAICGLGHCEWSLGAPERVHYDSGDKETTTSPYIIITKPDDSVFWPELHGDRAAKVSGDDWKRSQADAILLYEWVD